MFLLHEVTLVNEEQERVILKVQGLLRYRVCLQHKARKLCEILEDLFTLTLHQLTQFMEVAPLIKVMILLVP